MTFHKGITKGSGRCFFRIRRAFEERLKVHRPLKLGKADVRVDPAGKLSCGGQAVEHTFLPQLLGHFSRFEKRLGDQQAIPFVLFFFKIKGEQIVGGVFFALFGKEDQGVDTVNALFW